MGKWTGAELTFRTPSFFIPGRNSPCPSEIQRPPSSCRRRGQIRPWSAGGRPQFRDFVALGNRHRPILGDWFGLRKVGLVYLELDEKATNSGLATDRASLATPLQAHTDGHRLLPRFPLIPFPGSVRLFSVSPVLAISGPVSIPASAPLRESGDP